MSALPPQQFDAMRKTARAAAQPLESLSRRWQELHEIAAQIAALADLSEERDAQEAADFAERLDHASEWQRNLAWQGIEDIDAMMRPGITALRTITARGQDASAPALALWREFYAARRAVLAVITPAKAA